MSAEKSGRRASLVNTQCDYCLQMFTAQGIRMHEKVCKANSKPRYVRSAKFTRGATNFLRSIFGWFIDWLDYCWSGIWNSNLFMSIFSFCLLLFSIAAPIWILSQCSYYFWGLFGMVQGVLSGIWIVITFFVSLVSDFKRAKDAFEGDKKATNTTLMSQTLAIANAYNGISTFNVIADKTKSVWTN